MSNSQDHTQNQDHGQAVSHSKLAYFHATAFGKVPPANQAGDT